MLSGKLGIPNSTQNLIDQKLLKVLLTQKKLRDLCADYFNDTCKPNCIDSDENFRIKFHSEFKSYIGDYLCAGDFSLLNK